VSVLYLSNLNRTHSRECAGALHIQSVEVLVYTPRHSSDFAFRVGTMSDVEVARLSGFNATFETALESAEHPDRLGTTEMEA